MRVPERGKGWVGGNREVAREREGAGGREGERRGRQVESENVRAKEGEKESAHRGRERERERAHARSLARSLERERERERIIHTYIHHQIANQVFFFLGKQTFVSLYLRALTVSV